MDSLKKLTWEDVYERWELDAYAEPQILHRPLKAEEIHVNYDRQGFYFYGYDWLLRDEYEQRRTLIEKDIAQFLFAKPTNKGTIHTLQMLLEAETEEERTAVWIYAFCRDLIDSKSYSSAARIAHRLCTSVRPFLAERFEMWHHAMRRLTPEVFFSYPLLEETEITSVNALLHLIRINAALVLHEYVPILYSSLKPGERSNDFSVRVDK